MSNRVRFNRNVIGSSHIPSVKYRSHVAYIREIHERNTTIIQHIVEEVEITTNSIDNFDRGVRKAINQFKNNNYGRE